MSLIQYRVFEAQIPGETVALFGAIHGNEPSGTQACHAFIEALESWEISLLKWRLIIIPICNKVAYESWVRYCEKNLNRCFRECNDPQTQEEKYAQEIIQLLSQYNVTKLLDLHSTSGPSLPFMFCEKQHLWFWRQLGVPYLITGWKNMWWEVLTGDTENYMNNWGSRMGLTFEAGNHDSSDGASNAYQVILNFLSVCDMIDPLHLQPLSEVQHIIEMKSVYILDGVAFRYSLSSIENFRVLNGSDTLIGFSQDREGNETPIFAQEWDILVMPKAFDIHHGEEVFFLGREIEREKK